MKKPSPPTEFADQIRRRAQDTRRVAAEEAAKTRRTIEDETLATDARLRELGEQLRESASAEQQHTERAIRTALRTAVQGVPALWLIQAAKGIGIFIAVMVPLTVFGEWQACRLRSTAGALVLAKEQRDEMRAAIHVLNPETGGLRLRERNGLRYLVIPPGAEVVTIEGRAAILLPE